MQGLPGVAGGAILGDGNIALILDRPRSCSRPPEPALRPRIDHTTPFTKPLAPRHRPAFVYLSRSPGSIDPAMTQLTPLTLDKVCEAAAASVRTFAHAASGGRLAE